jgi:hypothetical protein
MNSRLKAKPDELRTRRVFAPRSVQATKHIITFVLIFCQPSFGTLHRPLHTEIS